MEFRELFGQFKHIEVSFPPVPYSSTITNFELTNWHFKFEFEIGISLFGTF